MRVTKRWGNASIALSAATEGEAFVHTSFASDNVPVDAECKVDVSRVSRWGTSIFQKTCNSCIRGLALHEVD